MKNEGEHKRQEIEDNISDVVNQPGATEGGMHRS